MARFLFFAAGFSALLAGFFVTHLSVSRASPRYQVVSDSESASLFGGDDCTYKADNPNLTSYCGGACPTFMVTVKKNTTGSKVEISVQCSATKSCGSYPTQLTACGK